MKCAISVSSGRFCSLVSSSCKKYYQVTILCTFRVQGGNGYSGARPGVAGSGVEQDQTWSGGGGEQGWTWRAGGEGVAAEQCQIQSSRGGGVQWGSISDPPQSFLTSNLLVPRYKTKG